MTTMMLQPQPPPGRAAPADPGAAPAAPAQAAPATEAQAGDGQGDGAPPPASPGAFGGMALVLPFLLLFGLLFLMNRGEKKKRAALESKLKRGDRVVTRSGIKGKLLEVAESTVKVEIAPGVNVMMVKAAVEGLDTADPASGGKGSGKAAPDAKGAKSRGGKGKGGKKGDAEAEQEEPAKEKKKRKWF